LLGLDWLGGTDLDVAPNLVAESDVVARLHAEISRVLANALRCLELDCPRVLLVRLNDTVTRNWFLHSHVITARLNE